MKNFLYLIVIVFLFMFFMCSGCEPEFKNSNHSKYTSSRCFEPSSVEIIPLTELFPPEEDSDNCKIEVYVSLQDMFGSQMKNPAVFRFELYEYVSRSATDKGRRLMIWPDIDLTDAVENNNYWQEFLRVYTFTFDFESQDNQVYVLQVTCILNETKRLLAELILKQNQ